MKKGILTLLAAALLLAPMSVSSVFAADAKAPAKTYVNGIDANYPPFAYIDEKTGKPAGFDVDSMTWIAEKMGFGIEHKPVAWDGIIPALQAKQIDMVCSGMSITDKRKKVVTFSEPYWTVSRVFLVKGDSSLTPEDILKKPVQLGVQRGTSEADAMQEEKKAKNYPLTLRFYESAPLAVEDLLNGRIDAALMDALPAEDAVSKGKAVKIAGTHGEPDAFGVAFRNADNELRAQINEGYELLKKDPYWEELIAKYLNK